ncbi:lysine-specific demethylase 2A [Tetranychus urticae]|uniref:lysine-specific demethylase 2A n=1 Tax=Tetranychus urticae TaxID=32264 RepID=UPI00077BE11A|nr:lysine-specific demethylase 2A [Tetranychus urticae]
MSKSERMVRKLRARERRRYTEEFGDEEIEGARMFDVEEKLVSDKFDKLFVKEMKGEELNLKYIQEHGFDSPIVIKNTKGLGLKMPDTNFTVSDVRQCVGSRRILDVMDVTTQKDFEMTMKEWCQYYENPVRDRLLNVISLEFSHTKLDSMVESPTIVRQVDWVDWVWPRHLKLQQTVSTNSIGDMKYPKVQKYCLMSVKGCYTDFHIDFGGTSVWYHILKGQKVFWLIPPSERNIQLFEQWVLSGKQSDIFFGDTVEQCARIRLYDGYTFFIPTGWIHAVYTTEDSLVFGGNFLHSFAIEKQLRIAQVEDITKVPAKFRYPFYHEMLWYVLQRYVYCLTGKSHLTVDVDGNPLSEGSSANTNNLSLYSNSLIKSKNGQHAHLTSFELNGLKAIIMWLGRLTGNKRAVPELIQNPEALLNDAKLLVDDHGNDNHKLAVTGHPLLFWNYGRNKSNVNPIDNLSSHLNSSLSFPAISSSSPFSSTLISNSSSPLSTSTSSSSLLSSSHTTTPSSTLPTSTSISSSSNLSITAQLRQIKNTSFTSAFHLSKSTSTTSQSETSTRPESPPTRPLSSNQYSINLTQLTKPLDQIPQSFAQLIAATGVGNQNRFNSPSLVPSNNNNVNNNLLMGFNNSASSTLPTATISSTSINVVNTQASELIVQKPNTDTYVVAIDSSDFSSGDMSKVDLAGGKNNPLNDSARRRRTRCKKCEACLRADCGDCHFCRDMKKFGGPGRMKQSCIARQCLAPVLPHTACCIICGRDGWEKMMPTSIDSEAQSSLLECSKCWEIVHPSCLKEKNPSLNIEGVMSDELPNSWECPKCIASIKFMTNAIKFNASNKLTTVTTSTSITGTSSKPANLSVSIEKPFIQQNSSTLKTQAPPSQDVYDFHTGDVLPEATCKRARFDEAMERRHLFEENNNSVKNSETTDEESDSTITSNSNSASNNGSISGKDKLSIISSTPSLTNTSKKTNDSHVRSCARFPLLQEAIKKQSQEKKASESEKKTSSKSLSESSSTSKGSRANKKHHQSARDRLFKSLKGLKKNSEMVRYSSNYNGMSSLNKKLPFKTGSPSNGMSSSASNGPSNTPSPILSRSTVDSPASTSTPPPSGLKATNSTDVIMKESTKESEDLKYKKADQYMFDDDTDNEIEEKENSMATSDDASSIIEQDFRPNDPPKIVVGTKSDGENLIKPKYVVRPAPLPEDLSDDDETEEGTDVDDTSEDESERSKVKKKFVKKLNRKVQGDLNIAREVILPVFRYLPLTDLMNCMYVCRKWNTWSMDPVLWKFLDLTRKKITYFALIGIVRRQPLHLNLSWTNISKRQLAWLMARLPQLQTLNLTGSSAASISALCSCNCPLLRKIDLSWVDSLNDNLIKDLLSYPSDSRPGLLETKTRLRLLTDISVAGSDISDVSIRLLCNHLPQLTRIDLSNCQKVTDMGVGFLGASKASKLVALNLSSCSNISDASLDALKRCTNIVHLDVRDCSQVSTIACQKFIATSSSKTRLMMKQTKLIVARNQRNPL